MNHSNFPQPAHDAGKKHGRYEKMNSGQKDFWQSAPADCPEVLKIVEKLKQNIAGLQLPNL